MKHLAPLLLLVVACGRDPVRVEIDFAPDGLADDAVAIEIDVIERCDEVDVESGAPATAARRSYAFRRGEDAPALGPSDGERLALYVRARTSSCGVIAAGCAEHATGVDEVVRVTVGAVSGAPDSCSDSRRCEAGLCVARDVDGGACASATEICDRVDQDCDGAIDEGEAATLCPDLPHVAAPCVAGTCTPGACEPGWDDCDDARPGCETSIDDDPTSCGACGRTCDEGLACRGGQCTPQPISVTRHGQCAGACGATDAAARRDGTTYVAGRYLGRVMVAGRELPANDTAFNGFVASIDPAGVEQWARVLPFVGGGDRIHDIAVTPDGSAWIAGGAESIVHVTDQTGANCAVAIGAAAGAGFLALVRSGAGCPAVQQTFAGSAHVRAIDVTATHVYASGGGGGSTLGGACDATTRGGWIARLRGDDAWCEWRAAIDTSGTFEAAGVGAGNGVVCAAGRFAGELAAEGDWPAVSGASGLVICVRETDGALVWRRGFDGEVRALALDVATSTVFVTGRHEGALVLDGGAPLPHRGAGDAWATGFAVEDGALRWARSWGGVAADSGDALARGDDGQVRFVGAFSSEARMDRALLTFSASGIAIASLDPASGADAWARATQSTTFPRIESAMVVDAGLMVLAHEASVVDLGDGVTSDTTGWAFSLFRWRDR